MSFKLRGISTTTSSLTPFPTYSHLHYTVVRPLYLQVLVDIVVIIVIYFLVLYAILVTLRVRAIGQLSASTWAAAGPTHSSAR